jgi:glycosyltransferase involved in cell wall biosynthesis
MPTANRQKYIPLAIDYFLNQSFRDAELVIIDDGKESIKPLLPDHRRISYYFYPESLGTIGVKRNIACEKAKGEVIMHWDDDDYYGYEWIRKSLSALENSGADICGLNKILFYSPVAGKFWDYIDTENERPWLSGATMTYLKSFWKSHPFKDIQVGEDYDYIWNTGAKIFAHDYNEGFIATLHAHNTTLKPFENPKLKKHATQWMDVPFEGKAENPKKSRYNHSN